MTNIMVNTNGPVAIENIRTYIAESPVLSVTKFAWYEFRFTIEHHAINEWTAVVESINSLFPVEYYDSISTFRLAEVLNVYIP